MTDTPQKIVDDLWEVCFSGCTIREAMQERDKIPARIQVLIDQVREEGRKEGLAETVCNRRSCAVDDALKECTKFE